VCVGPNDIDAGTAGLRARGNSKIERDVSITDIMSRLQKEVAEKALPSDMGSDTKEKGKGKGGGQNKKNFKNKGKAQKQVVEQPEFTKMEVRVGQIIEVCTILLFIHQIILVDFFIHTLERSAPYCLLLLRLLFLIRIGTVHPQYGYEKTQINV
jgi:hypothetical protein